MAILINQLHVFHIYGKDGKEKVFVHFDVDCIHSITREACWGVSDTN